MGTVPAVPTGNSCLSVCPPRSGLSEALEGEIGGVGTLWTCRDPQGDPCGFRGLLRAPHHGPAHREKRQAGTLPGLGCRAEPCLPPIPCPAALPHRITPGSGAGSGGREGVLASP